MVILSVHFGFTVARQRYAAVVGGRVVMRGREPRDVVRHPGLAARRPHPWQHPRPDIA